MFKYSLSKPTTIAITIAASTILLAGNASAELKKSMYLGTSIAYSSAKVSNIPTGNIIVSDDRNAVSGKIFAGVQLNKNFGLEVGYVNLGENKDIYKTNTVTGENIRKQQSMYLDGVVELPLTSTKTKFLGKTSLFGKFGLAYNTIKYTDISVTNSNVRIVKEEKINKVAPHFAIGINRALTDSLSLRAEYEHFGKVKLSDHQITSQAGSVGVNYRFK